MSRWVGRTASGRTSEYVRLLHLAATTGERRVEATLRARLNAGDPCDYASVQAQVRPAGSDGPCGPCAPPRLGIAPSPLHLVE